MYQVSSIIMKHVRRTFIPIAPSNFAQIIFPSILLDKRISSHLKVAKLEEMSIRRYSVLKSNHQSFIENVRTSSRIFEDIPHDVDARCTVFPITL